MSEFENECYREKTGGYQGGRFGGGMKWDIGVSRCKFLYIEWANNRGLLYITENHIQYPMKNHNGKNPKKRMCIYV